MNVKILFQATESKKEHLQTNVLGLDDTISPNHPVTPEYRSFAAFAFASSSAAASTEGKLASASPSSEWGVGEGSGEGVAADTVAIGSDSVNANKPWAFNNQGL